MQHTAGDGLQQCWKHRVQFRWECVQQATHMACREFPRTNTLSILTIGHHAAFALGSCFSKYSLIFNPTGMNIFILTYCSAQLYREKFRAAVQVLNSLDLVETFWLSRESESGNSVYAGAVKTNFHNSLWAYRNDVLQCWWLNSLGSNSGADCEEGKSTKKADWTVVFIFSTLFRCTTKTFFVNFGISSPQQGLNQRTNNTSNSKKSSPQGGLVHIFLTLPSSDRRRLQHVHVGLPNFQCTSKFKTETNRKRTEWKQTGKLYKVFIFFIKSKWFMWTIWLYLKSQHVYRVMRVTIRTVITTLPEPHPAKRSFWIWLSRCTSVIKHCNNNTPHLSHLCMHAYRGTRLCKHFKIWSIYYCYAVTVFAPTVCMVSLGKSLSK